MLIIIKYKNTKIINNKYKKINKNNEKSTLNKRQAEIFLLLFHSIWSNFLRIT
jgi:hypothetical protein